MSEFVCGKDKKISTLLWVVPKVMWRMFGHRHVSHQTLTRISHLMVVVPISSVSFSDLGQKVSPSPCILLTAVCVSTFVFDRWDCSRLSKTLPGAMSCRHAHQCSCPLFILITWSFVSIKEKSSEVLFTEHLTCSLLAIEGSQWKLYK